jgi:hypothetical protein
VLRNSLDACDLGLIWVRFEVFISKEDNIDLYAICISWFSRDIREKCGEFNNMFFGRFRFVQNEVRASIIFPKKCVPSINWKREL